MAEDLTPPAFKCVATMSCPSVHRMTDGSLLIVGSNAGKCIRFANGKEVCAGFGEHLVTISPSLLDTFVEEKTVLLRKRIEELEEALKPFLRGMHPDFSNREAADIFAVEVLGLHLLKARAALGTPPASSADEAEPARSAES